MPTSSIETMSDVPRQNFAAGLFSRPSRRLGQRRQQVFFTFGGLPEVWGWGPAAKGAGTPAGQGQTGFVFAQTADDEQRQAERRAWFPGWTGALTREPVASGPAAGGWAV